MESNTNFKQSTLGKSKVSVYLGLDPSGVVTRELLFSGGRDHDVAFGFQNAPFIGFGSWEAHNGAILLQKVKRHTREYMTKCWEKSVFPGEENHLTD